LYKKFRKFKIKNVGTTLSKVNNIHLKYDKEYLSFRGLHGLKDFQTNQLINRIEDFIKNEKEEKFYYGFLDSEYKRLEELKQKDYVYLSRVSPFITRFSGVGSDCRGNNYSLNLSESFGLSNFSPLYGSDKSENSFEFEWFLLENIPDYVNDFSNIKEFVGIKLNDIVKDNKSYLELLETDVSKDWFSIIFNKGYGMELNDNNLIENDIYENYSYFEIVKDSNYSIFKGVKYSFYEINNFGEKINPSNITDYKISAIFHLEHTVEESEIGKVYYKIIRNKKYKNIVILIILKMDLQDSRFLYGLFYDNFYYFKNIYSFINHYNNLPRLDFNHPPTTPYDYSHLFIEFERQVNKTDGSHFPVIGNVQNPFLFDFKNITNYFSSPFSFKYKNNENIKNENITYIIDYENSFLSYKELMLRYNILKDLNSVKYNSFIQSSHKDYCVSIKIDDNTIVNKPIELDVLNNQINIYFKNYNVYYSDINVLYKFPTFDINNFGLITNYDKESCYSLYNGFGFLKNVINNISYSSFKSKINLINGNINTELIKDLNFEFVTINEDGTKTNNDFIINIDDDFLVTITAKSIQSNVIEYSNIMNEGIRRFFTRQTKNKITLYRKTGFYEPKFIDVFEYKINDNEISDYYKINLFKLNTSFYFNKNFGLIKNVFFLKYGKINFKKIPYTSEETLISDIPDSKHYTLSLRDLNIFNTNYDYGFYIDNTNNDYVEINSFIFNQKESNTVFNGKLFKIPKKYVIDKFNYLVYPDQITPGQTSFDIDFDIISEILKIVEDKGGFQYWVDVFNELSITDVSGLDVGKKYIKENILDLFKIEKVFVYYKNSENYGFSFEEKPIDSKEWKSFKTFINNLKLRIAIEDKTLIPKTFYFKVLVELV